MPYSTLCRETMARKAKQTFVEVHSSTHARACAAAAAFVPAVAAGRAASPRAFKRGRDVDNVSGQRRTPTPPMRCSSPQLSLHKTTRCLRTSAFDALTDLDKKDGLLDELSQAAIRPSRSPRAASPPVLNKSSSVASGVRSRACQLPHRR